MNRREALTTIGAMALLPAAGATASPDVSDDVAILREALKLHPGLYRYASPKTVDDRLQSFGRAFTAAGSLEQRYLVLSRFMATIRCGHSYCNFFNQKKAVAAELFNRPTRLPFHFSWFGKRMIVTRDPSQLGLPPGTEILSINGVAPAAMLETLQPYARADGHNDAKRVALLGVAGTESIEFFDVFHGLIYGPAENGEHLLSIRLPSGRRGRLAVPAIALSARRQQMIKRDYDGSEPVWDWAMRPDRVALLTMPNWALYKSQWNWRQWLDERLNTLSGAKGLIVDLRENEGGEDCGDQILARLISQPLVNPGAEQRVRFRRTPPQIDRYLDTWDDSFRTLGADAEDAGNGFLRLTGNRADDVVDPKGPRVNVRVAILVGPVNSSATFQFADKARRSGVARLFGQPTGGNRRGINGGCYFFVRLPASGIEFDLPLIGYFPPGKPPDAGIIPDVSVAPTPADLAAGRDPVLTAASRWILSA